MQHQRSVEEGPDLAMMSRANGRTRGVGREHSGAVSGRAQRSWARRAGHSRCRERAYRRGQGQGAGAAWGKAWTKPMVGCGRGVG